MISEIAKAIGLKNEPVAILKSDILPEQALQFREGVWGCVIAMLTAASKGKTSAFSEKTTVCPGGKVGLGFGKFRPETTEYFISVGGKGHREGEFYKESVEYGRAYTENVPQIKSKEYLVLKPLRLVTEKEIPEAVIFLVNADQLSGLVTLANYDRASQDNVQIQFGSGCAQAILYVLKHNEEGRGICTIGLTDPSARKCIDKNILSFGIPYQRYLEMERKVEGSFLTRETWGRIFKRMGC